MAKNRIAHLEIFIGTWNTNGEVLATKTSPATTLIATDTYQWLPGKHFIIHQADARFGASPTRSTEVIGYDLNSKKIISRSYDDQGVSEVFDVALDGKRWRIKGKSVRFDGKFDAKGNKLSGLWELKEPQKGWRPWINLTLVRA